MFLLENLDEVCTLKQTQLMSFALIRLTIVGLYTKAIERWSVDRRCELISAHS